MLENLDATLIDIAGIKSKTKEKVIKRVVVMAIKDKYNDLIIENIYFSNSGDLKTFKREVTLNDYDYLNIGDILIYDGINYFKFTNNLLTPVFNNNDETICLLASTKEEIQNISLSIFKEYMISSQKSRTRNYNSR